MKTFPSNFTAEKNKKTGASPVWVLKCPFATGTIYLSDQTFTISNWSGEGSPTTKAWVKTWGQVDESISSGGIDGINISDFNMTVINDPDDASNILSIFENSSNAPETTDCELYLWFIDLDAATDPPQLIWVGNIVDWEETDELLIEMQLIDQAVRFNKYVGNKVTETDYPYADPDDYGKIIPIVFYGYRVPAVCVQGGGVSELRYSTYVEVEIASSDGAGTIIYINNPKRFPVGTFQIGINSEIMTVTRAQDSYPVIASRADNGTIAQDHWYNSIVWEYISECIYLLADHSAALQAIRAEVEDWNLLINSVSAVYGSGDTHANSGSDSGGIGFKSITSSFHEEYPNQACAVIPAKITKTEAEAILIDNNVVYKSTDLDAILGLDNKTTIRQLVELARNVTIGDGTHSHTIETTSSGSATYKGTSASGVSASDSAIDGNQDTYATLYDEYFETSITANFNAINSATRSWVWVKAGSIPNSSRGEVIIYAGAPGETTANTYVGTISNSQDAQFVSFSIPSNVVGTNCIRIRNTATNWEAHVYEIELEHEGATTEGTASASSTSASTEATNYQDQDTFTFTGNSVANAFIGDRVLATISGYDSIADFVNKWTGLALENIITEDSSGIYHSGAWYGGIQPYGVLLTYEKLMEWLNAISFQCRYYFRFLKGKAYFLYRYSSKDSQKDISRKNIRMEEDSKTTLKTARTPLNEVINKITIYYNRDWSKSAGDDGAYRNFENVQDDDSIAKYGEKEQPDLFYFDFIVTETDASALADFYLATFKDRKKLFKCEVFLNNSEVEFADWVRLIGRSYKCEVQEVDFFPGSGMEMRNDKISLLMKGMEYATDATAPTTTASVDSGLYTYDLEIALTVNEEDAYIHYTTDGAEPTTSSPVYASPILITQDTTLKFFAVDAANNQEAVQTKTYTIDKVAPVTTALTNSGTYYANGLSLEFSTSEPAVIYYTTDGSIPTTSSPVMTINSNPPYNKYILIYQLEQGTSIYTIKFFAKDMAGNQEAVQTRVYTLINDTVAPIATASVDSGLYNYDLSVELNVSEPATIYYTIDGAEPTTSSPVYASPILITQDTTLKFFAVDAANNQGAIQTKTYTIDKVAPTGTSASPAGRPYNNTSAQAITITTSESAYIYYTTDGAEPTTSSPSAFYNQYNTPPGVNIYIIAPCTLKFFAKDFAGNIEAQIHTEVYTLDTTAPITTASPASGTYTEAQTVTLTANEPATIYYSIDGSYPSLVYTESLVMNSSTILKFGGIDTAGNPSVYVTETYIINIAGAGWLAKANIPTPRVYHGSVEVNGKIYCIGGCDADWNVVGINEVYNPATDTWATLASMPTPRVWGFGIAAINNKIYIIGGEDINWDTVGTVEEYDIATDTWAIKADLPNIRDGLTASAVNDKIYCIGGYRYPNGILNINEEYDPTANTWTTKAPMPTARDVLASAVVDGKIYCLGGDSGGSEDKIKNEEYNPTTNTWAVKATVPTRRSNFTAAAVNGKIYCIGGYRNGIGAVNTNEEYNPATDTWAVAEGMTTSREALSAATANGKIYATGGYDSGGTVLNANEEYTS